MRGIVAVLILIGGNISAAPPDHAAYRQSLVDLMGVVGDINALAGPDAPGSSVQIERAAQLFAGFSDRQIDALAVSLPPSRLHAAVSQSRRLLAMPRRKTVVVAEPDVTPAFCNDYPAPVVLSALITKHVAQHVIEGLEFTCQESVLGFNGALGCEAPEIASAAADIASELADFCGNQQSAASNTAVLLTERSIGQHLNMQLDVVLSTRASQLSVDAAKATADASDAVSEEIAGQRDLDFVEIDAQINHALDNLAGLAATLANLQAAGNDIAFRVQVSQANVEDAQIRGANLQALADEQTLGLSASRNIAVATEQIAIGLQLAIDAMARQNRRDDLAVALGNADVQTSGFALPVAAGGRLEEAREVLIGNILALQSLGQGNTVQALALLATGDADYNAGRYADAWRRFGEAYRALDPHVTGSRGGTP